MRYKYFLVLVFLFNVFAVSSQSMIDALFFRKTRSEAHEYQVKKLNKWKVYPQIITVFNEAYIDSMRFVSHTLAEREDKTFSPIQFRVYQGSTFYTGWEYCFGKLSKIGVLYKDSIVDIERLPINRSLRLESDMKMIQLSEEQKREIKNAMDYDYIIIAFWDPYFGRSVRKMLQRLQKFINHSSSKKIFFITVNYNGVLEI